MLYALSRQNQNLFAWSYNTSAIKSSKSMRCSWLSGWRASADSEVSKWLQRRINVKSSTEKGAGHLKCLLSNSDTPQRPETHSPNWPSCRVWMTLTMTLPRMNSQTWVPTIPAGNSTGKALSDVQAQEFTLLTSTMGTLYWGHAGDLETTEESQLQRRNIRMSYSSQVLTEELGLTGWKIFKLN